MAEACLNAIEHGNKLDVSTKVGIVLTIQPASLEVNVTEARRQGRGMMVFGLSPHYQKIFRMVGLADYVEMCATEAEVPQRVKPTEV